MHFNTTENTPPSTSYGRSNNSTNCYEIGWGTALVFLGVAFCWAVIVRLGFYALSRRCENKHRNNRQDNADGYSANHDQEARLLLSHESTEALVGQQPSTPNGGESSTDESMSDLLPPPYSPDAPLLQCDIRVEPHSTISHADTSLLNNPLLSSADRTPE